MTLPATYKGPITIPAGFQQNQIPFDPSIADGPAPGIAFLDVNGTDITASGLLVGQIDSSNSNSIDIGVPSTTPSGTYYAVLTQVSAQGGSVLQDDALQITVPAPPQEDDTFDLSQPLPALVSYAGSGGDQPGADAEIDPVTGVKKSVTKKAPGTSGTTTTGTTTVQGHATLAEIAAAAPDATKTAEAKGSNQVHTETGEPITGTEASTASIKK